MLKKVLLSVLGALALLAAVLYTTLVAATCGPEDCSYRLDLAALRTLAGSIPGEGPREIRVERVAGIDMPGALARPGAPWAAIPFEVYAYQLVYANDTVVVDTIVVDTAVNRAQAEEGGMGERFDEAAWGRVAAAMEKASAVYVTHEHGDHMGGAVADERWASRVRLTPRQLDSTVISRPVISDAVRAAVQRVEYEGAKAVAPGVVLIEALGHTPGSQMVYVRRADGAEVIFTGDTAWLMQSIEHRQGPAKFATILMGSDRHAQSCQLAALDELRRGVPEVSIMPGHDPARMQELRARGVFVAGFQ